MSRPENIAVVGVPGSGKSYCLRTVLRPDPRLIYADPMDSASGIRGQGDNADWTHAARRASTVIDIMRTRQRFRISWGVGELGDLERREAIAEVLDEARRLRLPDTWTTVAVDEIGIVCPRGQDLPALSAALRLGRHRSVRVALASQRAVDMPPLWRSLCEDFRIFRQTERVDLDRLDTIRRGLGDQAAALEPFWFYRWHAGRLEGPLAPVRR